MKKIVLAIVSGVVLISMGASEGFSQIPAVPDRIIQPVIINGQQVSAAYVTAAGGGVQTFRCSAPKKYVPPEGASGWACYEAATGYWLLNALPPAPQVQAQPTVVYQQAPATVIYPASPRVVYAPRPV